MGIIGYSYSLSNEELVGATKSFPTTYSRYEVLLDALTSTVWEGGFGFRSGLT